MNRLRLTITTLLLVAFALMTNAQAFRNLTASEVRIDDELPVVSETFAIDDATASYSVSIDYPEYIDMTPNDVRRVERLMSGRLPETPHIDIFVGTEKKRTTLTASFVPIVFKEGRWKKIVGFKLTLHRNSLLKARTRSDDDGSDARYASTSVLAKGRWAKVRVGTTGIHELTAAVAAKAGFSDLKKVRVYGYGGALQPERLDGDYLMQTDDLKEVALCDVGGRRLFFAQGPVSWTSSGRTRNPYSDYGYYFITEGDSLAPTLSEEDFLNSFDYSAYAQRSLYERDDYAWYHGGRNLYDSQLFGNGNSRSFTLSIAKPSATGRLIVALAADQPLTATVTLNGTALGSLTTEACGSYDKARTAMKTFEVADLQEVNTVTVRQDGNGNMRLDYIALMADEPADRPDLDSSFPAAEYVSAVERQNLHADRAIDMVIVVPQSRKWTGEAERLRQLHMAKDGLSVRIVAEDELWNEFSSGTPDATALRRYMKMLYDRAASEADMPKYLLLFGDGAWDNRMLSADWANEDRRDFLLCHESENSTSAVDSYVTDDFFTMLDDGEQLATGIQYTGKPDVAVGRLTARTADEARTLVDKIERYLSDDDMGTWRNTLVFMGDDGNDNIHMEDADNAAEMVKAICPAMDIKKVMWDAYKMENSATGNSYPEVTRLLRQYMKDGALVMDYCGHGNANSFSHEYVLNLEDFKSVETTRLPLWITASCDIMPFDGQAGNIGETAMAYTDGGAIAFFGTTRTVYADRNSYINRTTLKYLFTPGSDLRLPAIGEAVRKAKVELASSYSASDKMQDLTVNKLQYVLLGDPALKLPCPTMTATVDSINGQPAKENTVVTLKAGETVRIAGHVASAGSTATDFNGTMTASVRGAEDVVTCRMNNTSAQGTDWAFTYLDRKDVIYRGTDSVRTGRFAFEFVVPKDITYSDATGQVLLYAADASGRQANGTFGNIAFNGTAIDGSDTVGPSIYCYLNSQAFANGDEVNSSPCFMAELFDESGINAAGTGIGHDLLLTIDDDPSMTYVLNDNFSFDFGSYRSGTVAFQIPALDEGDHSLTFRAWDIYNNSSTSTLRFRVSGSATPKLLDVESTANPASTTTSFRVIHDRVGSNMEVTVDVFDMAGRKLWTKRQKETPVTNTVTVDWDLTSPGGSRIGTGIYLYRVKMATADGEYTSKTKKLVVLSNK